MATEIGDPKDSGTRIIVGRGDGAWADVENIHMTGRIERVVMLPFGTTKGNPSVEMLIRTDDDTLIHANTTLALFEAMAKLFAEWKDRW